MLVSLYNNKYSHIKLSVTQTLAEPRLSANWPCSRASTLPTINCTGHFNLTKYEPAWEIILPLPQPHPASTQAGQAGTHNTDRIWTQLSVVSMKNKQTNHLMNNGHTTFDLNLMMISFGTSEAVKVNFLSHSVITNDSCWETWYTFFKHVSWEMYYAVSKLEFTLREGPSVRQIWGPAD